MVFFGYLQCFDKMSFDSLNFPKRNEKKGVYLSEKKNQ